MLHNSGVHIGVPTMNDMTLTALRKRLFRVADRILATGAPVRILRGGRVLTLAADPRHKRPPRLARLKRRNLISGDASGLWKVRPGRWRGRKGPG